jgi:hypothetical protein
LFLALAGAGALAACSSGGPRAGVDVDEGAATAAVRPLAPIDLAFLVPPPPAGRGLNPDLPAAAGPFLDAGRFHTMFVALENFENGRDAFGPEAETLARFFVAGVRFDPCAPQAFAHGTPGPAQTAPAKCERELRLVVQPWTAGDGTRGDDGYTDAAFHLVFRLDEATGAAALGELFALRDACEAQRGGPTADSLVGPHPCLADLPSADPAARARSLAFLNERVAPFLKKFATPGRLAGAAAMLGANHGEDNSWEWRLFVNGASGLTQVKALPFNPPDGENDTSVLVVDEGGVSFPAPSAKILTARGDKVPVERLQGLDDAMSRSDTKDDVVAGKAFGDPALQAGLVAAYAALNPRLNVLPSAPAQGKNGVDCTSCHIAGQITTAVEMHGGIDAIKASNRALFDRLDASAFGGLDVLGRGHLPAARAFLNQIVDENHTTEQFVINFGFRDRDPSISPRTVNEAADAAAFAAALTPTPVPTPPPDPTPTPTPPPGGGGVIINEILANEPGSAADAEFVEIVNVGAAPVDLSGWTLSDNTDVRHAFAAGTSLAPGEAVVVFGSASGVPGGLAGAVASSTGGLGLSNGGDRVTLADAAGGKQDGFAYPASLANVDGVSMSRPDGRPDGAFVAHTALAAGKASPGTRADGKPF